MSDQEPARAVEPATNIVRTALSHVFWAQWAVMFILILVCAGIAMTAPALFQANNLSPLLMQSTIIACLAAGQAFVMIAGGLDLSLGAMVVFVGVILGIANGFGWPAALVLTCGALAGCLAGVFNGVLVTRARLAPFIVTFATMSIISGCSLLLKKNFLISAFDLATWWPEIGKRQLLLIAVLVIAVILLVAAVGLSWLRIGRYIIAVGANEGVVHRFGIAVQQVRLITYVISGTLAGLGGIIAASGLSTTVPAVGVNYVFLSIAAALVGGVSLRGGSGTITGSIMGAIVLSILLDGLSLLKVQGSYQSIALGIVVITAIVVRRLEKTPEAA